MAAKTQIQIATAISKNVGPFCDDMFKFATEAGVDWNTAQVQINDMDHFRTHWAELSEVEREAAMMYLTV